MIRALGKERDVNKTSIKADGDIEVVFRRQKRNCETAKNAIKTSVDRKIEEAFQDTIFVPADGIGCVVGRSGATIHRIKSTHGVRVYLSDNDGHLR